MCTLHGQHISLGEIYDICVSNFSKPTPIQVCRMQTDQ